MHAGSGAEWQPPPAEGARAWNHRVLRQGARARRIETDLLSGRRVLVVEEDGGDLENLDTGLCSGETLRELWEVHPDDPASARAVHVWEQRLARGDWSVRTRAEAEMTGTATELRMTARLTAWHGDAVIFQRDFDEKVPRRFV